MEFDPNKQVMEVDDMRQLAVLHVTAPLGMGMGSITAEHPLTGNKVQQYAEESVLPAIEKIEAGAPGGCIDGRRALRMLNGAEVKRGSKSAGGNAVSTFVGLELVGYFKDGGSALQHFARTVDQLEATGNPVGFHTDSKRAEALARIIVDFREQLENLSIDETVELLKQEKIPLDGTGCGANDAVQPINRKLSRRPQQLSSGALETAEQVQARLDYAFNVSGAMADEPLHRATFETLIDTATAQDEADFYDEWHSVKALIIADKLLLMRGVTDGVLGRIQVLEDDGKGVHGHTEDAVIVIRDDEHTVEPGTLLAQSDSKSFIVNPGVATRGAEISAQPAARDAILLYQVATQMHLTDGSQPAIIIG